MSKVQGALSARLCRLQLALFGGLLMAGLLHPAHGQVLPDGANAAPWVCPAREGDDRQEAPRNEAEVADRQRRARYREVFPAYVAAVPPEPAQFLLMPLAGVRVASVADTWGGARDGGRTHEGQDIFAPRGTPVFAAAPGFVYRVGDQRRGGNVVIVVSAGGHRHYYAHLDRFGDIREGQAVDVTTVLGFVGTSGNAAGTPPHLHFGIYASSERECDWDAIDPLPLLIDRTP